MNRRRLNALEKISPPPPPLPSDGLFTDQDLRLLTIEERLEIVTVLKTARETADPRAFLSQHPVMIRAFEKIGASREL